MNKLEELAKQVVECQRCELRYECTNPVPGNGAEHATYVILGEAPGREEDVAGVPFVGMAGKRLNRLIGLSNMNINDCYLTNVIKCRPPKNRTPRRGEVKFCLQWLLLELDIIQPKYIITLGATPLSLFTTEGIRTLHGTLLLDMKILPVWLHD